MEWEYGMVCEHDVISFIKDNIFEYAKLNDSDIANIVLEHIKYGTYDEMRHNGKVIAVVRYNIDGPTAEILDLIIAPGYNSLYIMRRFIVRGWTRFPYLRFVSYYRGYKRPQRRLAILSIKKLLRVK